MQHEHLFPAGILGMLQGSLFKALGALFLQPFCNNHYFYKLNSSYYNLVEALRRAPDTFAHLFYYSQLTMHFKAKDGKARYCRYRAIPGDVNIKEEDESGRLTEEEQRKIWYPVIFLVAKITDTQRSRAQNRVVFFVTHSFLRMNKNHYLFPELLTPHQMA